MSRSAEYPSDSRKCSCTRIYSSKSSEDAESDSISASSSRSLVWSAKRSSVADWASSNTVLPAVTGCSCLRYPTLAPRLKVTEPESGSHWWVRILRSVDLPAPFLPTRATRSLGSRRKETPVRISSGPNAFLTFETERSTGVYWGRFLTEFLRGTKVATHETPLLGRCYCE